MIQAGSSKLSQDCHDLKPVWTQSKINVRNPQKSNVVVQACSPSTLEAETGGLGVQTHLWVHCNSSPALDTLRPCLKTTENAGLERQGSKVECGLLLVPNRNVQMVEAGRSLHLWLSWSILPVPGQPVSELKILGRQRNRNRTKP